VNAKVAAREKRALGVDPGSGMRLATFRSVGVRTETGREHPRWEQFLPVVIHRHGLTVCERGMYERIGGCEFEVLRHQNRMKLFRTDERPGPIPDQVIRNDSSPSRRPTDEFRVFRPAVRKNNVIR
jgi:hypothetical protein